MDQEKPSGHDFFKRTVFLFSLIAALGFLVAARRNPFQLSYTLLVTILPAVVFFLLLQFVLYLRSRMRWLLLRHILDTLLKVGFLVVLALLIHAAIQHGWFTELWGMAVILLGTLVGFVGFSWAVEAALKRYLGERTDEETDRYAAWLDQLDTLSHWKIVLMLIPNLKKGNG